ncbi:MAG: ComEC/Rec2 family competence protein [Oscillospiraceae bacterium]|jgi:competence protein ComEC|nr:ComEC/Rec2 family competence protein [Oscillospiraceae bacterium]
MRKLAAAAAAFSAAILLAYYVLPDGWGWICAAVCCGAALFSRFLKGGARRRVLVVCLFLAAGLLWYEAYGALYIAPARAFSGNTLAARAVALDYPERDGDGARLSVRVFAGARGVKTMLYINSAPPDTRPGDVIEFEAYFRAARTEDGENITALTSRGYVLRATLRGEASVTGRRGAFWFFPRELARALAEKMNALFPEDVAPFMRALILGDTTELRADAGLDAALGVTGTSHVVSVSGMHVSYLLGIITLLTKKRRGSAFFGIPILLVFMGVAGFGASVTRAVIMQSLLLSAPLFRRRQDSLTSISAALFLLLAVNPLSCANIGLQLSFLATLGIVLFSGRAYTALTRAARRRPWYENRFFKAAFNFIAASLCATFGALVFTTPLTALYFGYVSILAPLMNILVLWAASLAFCLGLAAAAIGFALPTFGAAAALASLPARYFLSAVRLLARFPFAAVYVSNPFILFWLTYVYGLFAVFFILRGRLRRAVYPVCMAAVSLCVMLLFTAGTSPRGDMTVTALNVGQGQSVAVTAGGGTAVIDCGSSSGSGAGGAVREYLAANGRTKIDLLILTHFHADHANGVTELLSLGTVSALVIPDPELDNESYLAEDIIELARRRGADIIYVTETMRFRLGDAVLTVYPPLGEYGMNERGLTILCTDGQFDALITGDMDENGERRLLDYTDLPDIELLVVGHHGSKYATSEELLEVTRPELAVISVGRNSYGHPTPETLARLAEAGVTVYRTDISGNITFKANGGK